MNKLFLKITVTKGGFFSPFSNPVSKSFEFKLLVVGEMICEMKFKQMCYQNNFQLLHVRSKRYRQVGKNI
jgi:hypothetical protein